MFPLKSPIQLTSDLIQSHTHASIDVQFESDRTGTQNHKITVS